MTTLTEEKEIVFCPDSVDSIQKYLWKKIDNDWNSESYEYVMRKNIAYSFQYLQYLDNQIFINPTEYAVIRKMQYKTFIITAFGILESILYHDLKKKGLIKKEVYRELPSERKCILNSKNTQKIEIKYFEKIDEVEQKDEFIKTKELVARAQNAGVFGNDHNIYAKINGMRKLRDKVHIYISGQKEDTDWNSFKEDVYERNKNTFLEIYSNYFEETVTLNKIA